MKWLWVLDVIEIVYNVQYQRVGSITKNEAITRKVNLRVRRGHFECVMSSLCTRLIDDALSGSCNLQLMKYAAQMSRQYIILLP